MAERRTVEAARRKKELGEAPSTQAGEFVREEMHHIREGKHGARSTKQAIAIGLSKARRAGVELPPPAKGTVPEETRRGAERDAEVGRRRGTTSVSARRSRATTRALKAEGHSAASTPALARQARTTAKKRGATARSAAARKAARTRASVASGRRKRAQSAAKRTRRA
ncbi:MAG TPA: DUF6496 domain-containing protein [Candidatus Dormibacteraeota bacterium]|nr:DUF6496 domain-containing protein [Candidatus Dormibacteraeota bacterium]